MTVAIYAGSFDPFTFGHQAVAYDAMKLSRSVEHARLVIAIGINTSKSRLFSEEERIEIAKSYFTEKSGVMVRPFKGLLVDFCEEISKELETPVVIVRGLRAVSDYETEMAIAAANRKLSPAIQTLFIPTQPEVAYVSSSIVKEIAKSTDNVSRLTGYVKEDVARMLMERVRGF